MKTTAIVVQAVGSAAAAIALGFAHTPSHHGVAQVPAAKTAVSVSR
jgi:hypothetical protein